MIRPIRWLWKQLTGVHISAVAQGIYNLVFTLFDDTLNYFNNFSVATARDEHLSLLGVISGLTRAIVELTNEQYFLFTAGYWQDREKGFAELIHGQPGAIGGTFIDLYDPAFSGGRQYVPAAPYREMLQCASKSEGSLRPVVSVKMLDDLAFRLPESLYIIGWYPATGVSQRTCGDLYLKMDEERLGNKALNYRDALYGAVNSIDLPTHRVDVELQVLTQEDIDKEGGL